jgi:hypothetical protein
VPWSSRYHASLRQLLMLTRTEDPATVVLLFADRDTDNDNPNQGHSLVLGATETNTSNNRLSKSHVPTDGAGGSAMG